MSGKRNAGGTAAVGRLVSCLCVCVRARARVCVVLKCGGKPAQPLTIMGVYAYYMRIYARLGCVKKRGP